MISERLDNLYMDDGFVSKENIKQQEYNKHKIKFSSELTTQVNRKKKKNLLKMVLFLDCSRSIDW